MKNKLIKGVILEIISFILLVAPLGILIWVNNEKWIQSQFQGQKLGFGFILAVVFILCLLRGAFKDLDKRLTTVMSLAVMLVFVWCIDSIIQDLKWIILCSIIGYICYIVVNSFAKYYLNYVKNYNAEKAHIDARNDVEDVSRRRERGW